MGTPAVLLERVQNLGWPAIAHTRQDRRVHAQSTGQGRGSALLLIGGVHGDEPSSVEALLDLVEQPPPLGPTAPEREICIVPALNPDGIARNHKDNAAGVDLNRNFPASNFSLAHGPGYFPGGGPASEPETSALVALIARLEPVAVVAVHAPFACVNYDGPAAVWAGAVSTACGWPVKSDIGYPTPGSLGSWLGRDRSLPVLTLEFPPGPFAAFAGSARAALMAAIANAPC